MGLEARQQEFEGFPAVEAPKALDRCTDCDYKGTCSGATCKMRELHTAWMKVIEEGNRNALYALGLCVHALVKSGMKLRDAESVFRRAYVNAALGQNEGNQSRTARNIGVHRNSLISYMREP